jgi:hypothetical protein
MDPVYKRKFYAFISHAHADKEIVDQIFSWLNRVANIPVWYDAHNLTSGIQIATYLGEVIKQCRAMIIILSKASVESGWVKEEFEVAMGQRASTKGAFTIIPIKIEECKIPSFLETTKWMDIKKGHFSINEASELILSLYKADIDLELGRSKDVFVSCSWRMIPEKEFFLTKSVCSLFAREGVRLIGDSKDQKGFRENRLESIITSCGGLIAILPDRG